MSPPHRPGSTEHPYTLPVYWIGYVLSGISILIVIVTLVTTGSVPVLWVVLAVVGLFLSLFRIVFIPMNHFYVLNSLGNFRGYLRGGGGRWYLLPPLFGIKGSRPYWVNHQIVIDLSDVSNNRTPGQYPYQLEGTLILRHDPTYIPTRDEKIDLADELNLESILIHNAKLLVHKEVQSYLYELDHDSLLDNQTARVAISDRIRSAFREGANSSGLIYSDHTSVAVYADIIDRKRQEALGDVSKPTIAFEHLRDYLQAYNLDLDELRRYGSAHRPVYQQERTYEFSRGQAKHEQKAEEARQQQERDNQAVMTILDRLHLNKDERSSTDYSSAVRIAKYLLQYNIWDGEQVLYLEGVHHIEQWLQARSDIELEQLQLNEIPGVQDETSRMSMANERLKKPTSYRSLGGALLERAREGKQT